MGIADLDAAMAGTPAPCPGSGHSSLCALRLVVRIHDLSIGHTVDIDLGQRKGAAHFVGQDILPGQLVGRLDINRWVKDNGNMRPHAFFP